MTPTSLYAADAPKGWLPWGAFAPLLLIVFVAASDITASRVLRHFHLVNAKGDPVSLIGLYWFLLFTFILIGLVFLGWILLVERRSLATIGLLGSHRTRTFLSGHAIGLATISVVITGIWLAGGYTGAGYGRAFGSLMAPLSISALLLCFALQSSVEEIIFRGWLLSGIARKFNVPIAVLLSCVVFTLLHYGPKQHWATTTGSFLFAAFACAWALRAGNIWGVMGWHAGWNWLLAVGFELPVTGLNADVPALLVKLTPHGTVLLNGGTRGPEGSIACNVFFIAGIALLLWRSRRPSS